MSDPIQFMSPRLDGKRFEKHSIPLEMLKDLAVLEELIVEVAKWHFLSQHRDRIRTRKFSDGISVDLTGISEGSAKPMIALVAASFCLLPHPNIVYFEQARESIIAAVNAAEHDEPITDHLPDFLLGYFDRIGRSLREGEVFEFSPENAARPARLTKATRRKLLLASPKVQELTEDVTLRGTIPVIDKELQTFALHVLNGPKVPGKIPELHRKAISEAYDGFEQGLRVVLKGVGRFNRSDKLQAIDSIEHISVLDTNDVPARIEELKNLKDGWLDGKGSTLSSEGLDWFAKIFEANYPDELPLPFVYPTAEGGIQVEWSLGGHELSLEIDFARHSGEWHRLKIQNQQEDNRSLNLEDDGDWKWLANEIRQLAGAQG